MLIMQAQKYNNLYVAESASTDTLTIVGHFVQHPISFKLNKDKTNYYLFN